MPSTSSFDLLREPSRLARVEAAPAHGPCDGSDLADEVWRHRVKHA